VRTERNNKIAVYVAQVLRMEFKNYLETHSFTTRDLEELRDRAAHPRAGRSAAFWS